MAGRRQTFLAARRLGADFDKMEGRNKQIYSLYSLEAEDLQLEAEDLSLEAKTSRFQPVNTNIILLGTNL